MSVYQVVFEKTDSENKITDVIQYVESPDLKGVALKMAQRAEEMEWDLKQIRYLLTVSERIE